MPLVGNWIPFFFSKGSSSQFARPRRIQESNRADTIRKCGHFRLALGPEPPTGKTPSQPAVCVYLPRYGEKREEWLPTMNGIKLGSMPLHSLLAAALNHNIPLRVPGSRSASSFSVTGWKFMLNCCALCLSSHSSGEYAKASSSAKKNFMQIFVLTSERMVSDGSVRSCSL